jgi:hypothetical protein
MTPPADRLALRKAICTAAEYVAQTLACACRGCQADNQRVTKELNEALEKLDPMILALTAAAALCQAVEAWAEAKKWADENASLMLSSTRTADEAALIMREYFDKEAAALAACAPLRAALGANDAT